MNIDMFIGIFFVSMGLFIFGSGVAKIDKTGDMVKVHNDSIKLLMERVKIDNKRIEFLEGYISKDVRGE